MVSMLLFPINGMLGSPSGGGMTMKEFLRVPPPSPISAKEFNSRADAFLDALPSFYKTITCTWCSSVNGVGKDNCCVNCGGPRE